MVRVDGIAHASAGEAERYEQGPGRGQVVACSKPVQLQSQFPQAPCVQFRMVPPCRPDNQIGGAANPAVAIHDRPNE